jgi:hypothetical protein
MRRLGFIAVASLALLALAVPVVDARHGPRNGSHGSHSASVSAKTNVAPQGGALHIVAKMKHPTRGANFSASAVVHFASGDVTVQLKRHGKSFVAAGNVPVNSDETPGTVPVDVTVQYGDTEQEVETDGTVEDDQGDNADDQGDDQACDPATTTCDGADDPGDDQGGDETCDPQTTTCNDDDPGDQGDDSGGDQDGSGPGSGD